MLYVCSRCNGLNGSHYFSLSSPFTRVNSAFKQTESVIVLIVDSLAEHLPILTSANVPRESSKDYQAKLK